MIDQGILLKYIKTKLGFPYVAIEMTDDEILDFIVENTLPEYSRYFPFEKKMGFDFTSNQLLVPGSQNEFYVIDDEGLEIIDIKEILWTSSNYMMHGHPVFGSFGAGGPAEFALNVANAMMSQVFSPYNKSFHFTRPNIVRISPRPDDCATIIYETEQPVDLRGIKYETQTLFKDLCLADIKIALGVIRKKYTDLNTPFGTITLDTSIKDEGEQLRTDILQQLKEGSLPSITVDFA